MKRNQNMISFYCCEQNDFYRSLMGSGHQFPCFDKIEDLLKSVPEKSGILILADAYPCTGAKIKKDHIDLMQQKQLRVYMEYPESLPGLKLGEPEVVQYERMVVTSDFFGSNLMKNTILNVNSCWFQPAAVSDCYLALGRVAGYDMAVYGLPEKVFPVLFPLPESNGNILIGTCKLSHFITGRYGPAEKWKLVWERILNWLSYEREMIQFSWTPAVDTCYRHGDSLPEDAEKKTLERSFSWFRDQVVYGISKKKGAIEGFESAVNYEGKQMRRTWVRSDCTAETAMVMAFEWALTGNPERKKLAQSMMDYIWHSPDFYQSNPSSPVYGLVNWYEQGAVFYGDDNARVILSTLVAGRLLHNSSWDEKILKSLLANLRTTGKLGFRNDCLIWESFFVKPKRGWKYYQEEDFVSCAPHYQAYLWAAYLWAYSLTSHEEFLDKTKTAIKIMMTGYPHSWQWQNGFTGELARMLLPLAFLIQIEDTEEHRQWLDFISEELLKHIDDCGAIQERMGLLEKGKYPPPQSNEAYGASEASLIQENGNPCTDLVYTANWAFLGLHEAVMATGDKKLKAAEDKMAEFFCRIQVNTESHPYLNGAWMRGFDYQLWEYWGSSADCGWGAWCVESGWTNSWIAVVLALRQMNQSLFNPDAAGRFKEQFPRILKEMEKEVPFSFQNAELPLAQWRPGAE